MFARGAFNRILACVLGAALICALPLESAQGQRRPGREAGKDLIDRDKNQRDQADGPRIRNEYEAYRTRSYGVDRVNPEIVRYTGWLFGIVNSPIITKTIPGSVREGIGEIVARQLGAELQTTLSQYTFAEMETARFSQPDMLARPLALVAARHAFDESWSRLFSPTVVDLVPRNAAEFTTVFGGLSPSAAQVAELERIQRDEEVQGKLGNTGLDQAFSSASDIIIVIAHNDEGKLIDRNGAKLDLAELSRRCAGLLKMCVFLACNANKYVSDVALTPAATGAIGARDAINLARKIRDLADRARAGIEPEREDDPSLRPHPALVVARYMELIKETVVAVEATGSGNSAYYKLLLIKSATGVVVAVVVALAVCMSSEREKCQGAIL